MRDHIKRCSLDRDSNPDLSSAGRSAFLLSYLTDTYNHQFLMQFNITNYGWANNNNKHFATLNLTILITTKNLQS